jgi:hypothetical protein
VTTDRAETSRHGTGRQPRRMGMGKTAGVGLGMFTYVRGTESRGSMADIRGHCKLGLGLGLTTAHSRCYSNPSGLRSRMGPSG